LQGRGRKSNSNVSSSLKNRKLGRSHILTPIKTKIKAVRTGWNGLEIHSREMKGTIPSQQKA
jgi:hypothetical protein